MVHTTGGGRGVRSWVRGAALRSRADRARRGAWYTPDLLAAKVAELALPRIPDGGAVLDPACGDGALLVAAARRLRALGAPRLELCGVDRDARALDVARARLRAEGAHATLIRADFLLGDPALPPVAAVVANPPFLSVKRAHLSPRDRSRLRARFALARGQFDTCALFLERTLSLLGRGGRWAFVLPRPVLGNGSHAALRALLLERGGLEHVIEAGAPFDAAVEVVVLAGGGGPARKIRCHGASGALADLDSAVLRSLPGTPLPVGATEEELADRARLLPGSVPLGELVTIARGVEAGKRTPGVVPAGTPGATPVRAGEDVGAGALAAPGLALREELLPARHLKSRALYAGPKLLVRRVAPTLIAAVDGSSLPVLNTLYVLRPRDTSAGERLLHELAALLNGEPLRRWYALTYVAGDRIFPYVRASQLASLPIPGHMARPGAQ